MANKPDFSKHDTSFDYEFYEENDYIEREDANTINHLIAENEKLKAELSGILEYLKKHPVCELCQKYINKDDGLYTKECESCGWYPWSDENVTPYTWEWCGVNVAHGKWIMRGGKRYCSVCGSRACVTRDTDDFWYTVGTKYCPECGAKMED